MKYMIVDYAVTFVLVSFGILILAFAFTLFIRGFDE